MHSEHDHGPRIIRLFQGQFIACLPLRVKKISIEWNSSNENSGH